MGKTKKLFINSEAGPGAFDRASRSKNFKKKHNKKKQEGAETPRLLESWGPLPG